MSNNVIKVEVTGNTPQNGKSLIAAIIARTLADHFDKANVLLTGSEPIATFERLGDLDEGLVIPVSADTFLIVDSNAAESIDIEITEKIFVSSRYAAGVNQRQKLMVLIEDAVKALGLPESSAIRVLDTIKADPLYQQLP